MKTLLMYLLLCISLGGSSQNNFRISKKYYRTINKAELSICRNNLEKASVFYSKAFKHNSCPFSLDIYNCFLLNMMINKDSVLINSCLRILAERGYEMIIYKRYFGSKTDIFPGFSKIDTSIFRYTPVKTQEKKILDFFLSEDQRLRNLAYENMPPDSDVSNLSLYIDLRDTLPYFDSMNLNSIALIKYMERSFPNECVGKLNFNPTGFPLYMIIFMHFSEWGLHPHYDSLLYEKTFTGEFHPEWYQFLYYDRKSISGTEWKDLYGYPIEYITYDDDPNRRDFSTKDVYSGKKLRQINKNRKKLNLESYQDYLIKSKFEFDSNRFRLTYNRNVAFQWPTECINK